MNKDYICPNCRSVLRFFGSLIPNSPALQKKNCPVCSQELWLPRGLMPIFWQEVQVLQKSNVIPEKTVNITQKVPDEVIWESPIKTMPKGLQLAVAGIVIFVIFFILRKMSKR